LIFNFPLGRKGILLGPGAKLSHQTRQNKLKKNTSNFEKKNSNFGKAIQI
jgi:hypothetical protein